MQKPISRLRALCVSLESACLNNVQDEDSSAADMMGLPRVRLAAVTSALDNLVFDSVRGMRVMNFHAEAQKAAHELLAKFDRCSERVLGVPVSRPQAIAMLNDAYASTPAIWALIEKLDGACSETHEMFR